MSRHLLWMVALAACDRTPTPVTLDQDRLYTHPGPGSDSEGCAECLIPRLLLCADGTGEIQQSDEIVSLTYSIDEDTVTLVADTVQRFTLQGEGIVDGTGLRWEGEALDSCEGLL